MLKKNEFFYGIISLILLFVLIAIYIYYEICFHQDFLKYETTDFLLEKKIENIYEYYNTKEYDMNTQNGLVVCGEIPYDCFYWGITAKSDTYQTVSIKNYETIHPGELIYIILAYNKNMFNKIKKSILKEMKSGSLKKKRYKIVEMYSNGNKQSFSFFKINRNNVLEQNFKFSCRLYSFEKKLNFIPHSHVQNKNKVIIENFDYLKLINKYKIIKQLSLQTIRESEDYITFTANLNLKKNEIAVIVATDNSVVEKSIFSNIFINNKSYVAGNIYLNKTNKNKKIFQIIETNQVGEIKITENIFYNPSTLLISNILTPMSIYICEK